jgi:hypothetical protein
VDVEDREVGAAGLEELRRVGGRRGLADGELDAAVGVEAVGERRVDSRVHGVRLEVQNEGRLARGARFSTAVAARREGERGEDGRQRRDDLHPRASIGDERNDRRGLETTSGDCPLCPR